MGRVAVAVSGPARVATSEPLRVLLVEDSEVDADLVVRELRRIGRPVEHRVVETEDAMRECLLDAPWDLVLSDWSMPQFSAPGALALVRSLGLDLPFIIVSGTIGEEAAVEAMRAGAHDYVLKDRLGRLVPAVMRELRESEVRRARHRAEKALRESEARFRRLAESGLVGIVIAEGDGGIVEANDAFLALVGYARAELGTAALRWPVIAPPGLPARNADAYQQLRTYGVARPWEEEYVRKDGARVPVLVGMATLDGTRTISVSIDLTGLRQAEAGRAHAEGALRRSEEQLRQAQKMEAVGRLAGGIAHDFNNVLSVVLSYGEMLLMDLQPGEPMRESVEEIRKAAKRAADLTRQLLMFSRQQVVEPKVVDLNDVLAGLDKMLRRILGADVDLASLSTTPLGRVRVDPGSMEQVVMNLVVNARDAMPTGGKLTMETANVELDEAFVSDHYGVRPGHYVMLAVTDSGVGMDKATLGRVFEPFFTTKEKGKGTGLGLSTVFGIVQQAGGNIWVYSEPGKGTTFKIYLPRVDAEVEALRTTMAPSTLRGSETILLVEDDDQVRAVARGILRKAGYQVLEASNAGEAQLAVERHRGTIHLLLTDVVMPQMSGPQLVKRLASARPEMKVLCMSGYTDDSIVRHGVLDSNVAYIQKPITPESLTSKVRAVLDARGGGGG
jgi:two-component system cell cycle sensor histidine kinase/response regulator CckA